MRPLSSHLMLVACAVALAAAFSAPLQQPTSAAGALPPTVPTNIQVPSGNKLFLVGHAIGTQNYVCLPSGTGVKFVLF